MSEQLLLKKVWTILGTLLFAWVLNMWILSQGGPSLALKLVPGYDGRVVIGSYFTMIVSGALLAVLCYVGARYASLKGKGKTWAERLPLVGVGDENAVDFTQTTVRLYQIAFLVAFVLIPSTGLYHFGKKVYKYGVIWNDRYPPATAVALRNILPLASAVTAIDPAEKACSAEISIGGETGIWLAERPCDAQKHAGLPPFEQRVITPQTGFPRSSPDSLSGAPACIMALASRNLSCGNQRDLSAACAKDERLCRGVAWLPIVSPLLILGSALTGWISAGWFLWVIFGRGRALRKVAAPGE